MFLSKAIYTCFCFFLCAAVCSKKAVLNRLCCSRRPALEDKSLFSFLQRHMSIFCLLASDFDMAVCPKIAGTTITVGKIKSRPNPVVFFWIFVFWTHGHI